MREIPTQLLFRFPQQSIRRENSAKEAVQLQKDAEIRWSVRGRIQVRLIFSLQEPAAAQGGDHLFYFPV
jgi:hypothetical protein